MIHVSDNGSASAIFGVVGREGLRRLARRSAMTDFAPAASWGGTQISAADQARFFHRQDRLVPRAGSVARDSCCQARRHGASPSDGIARKPQVAKAAACIRRLECEIGDLDSRLVDARILARRA